MSDLDENTEPPQTPRIARSDLLAELSRRYTEIKVCHDDEDGYFLKYDHDHNRGMDHWRVMELDLDATHLSVDAAIMAAVKWHNEECTKWPQSEYLKPISC